MPQEFPAMTGNASESQQAARSGLAEVYSIQTGQRIDTLPNTESEINPARIAFNVASEIAAAREAHLSRPQQNKNNGLKGFIAKKFFGLEIPSNKLSLPTMEEMIEDESNIGGKLFPTNRPVIVKFWNAGLNDWYYHECKTDNSESVTLHYEILEMQRILRISSDPSVPNAIVTGKELDNFTDAVQMYRDSVNKMYSGNSDKLAA